MAAGEQRRGFARIGAALVACAAIASCTTSEPPNASAGPPPWSGATGDTGTCSVERSPLVLPDGIQVYVEPQNLFEVGGHVLVAGVPTYTWEVGSAANAIRLTQDAHVAATLDAGARRTVPRPPSGADVALGTMRAVALGDGRWGALFTDEDPDSLADHRETVRRLWYGEFDGSRWTPLEAVPRPAGGALYVNESSRLVRVGARLAWAAVHYAPPAPPTLVFYQRARGRWTFEPLPGGGVDNAELAYDDAQGLLLVVFGEDADLPGQKSIRLYRRTRGWDLVQRIAVPPPGALVSPSLIADASGVSVGWTELSGRVSSAYVRTHVTATDLGRRLTLDQDAQQLEGLAGLDIGHVWIVDHANPVLATRDLRFLRVDSVGAGEQLATSPNPYTGYFAALAASPSEIVVVGPEFNPDPTRPVVRSLLLSLSTTCH